MSAGIRRWSRVRRWAAASRSPSRRPILRARAALGLIDTTAWYGPEAPKNWAERADKAAQEGMAALVGFPDHALVRRRIPCATPGCRQGERRCFPAQRRQRLCGDLQDARRVPTCARRSRCLKMPTAVIVGEEDYATPVAMAQALHDGIAGSTLTVLPKARHLTPLEVPDIIAAELDRLMARVK